MEKYVDSEICVPAVLHDENMIRSMVNGSLDKDAVSPSTKRFLGTTHFQMQAQNKLEFDRRIKRNIDDIEKRLGLKKTKGADYAMEYMNYEATNKNIDLLKSQVMSKVTRSGSSVYGETIND